MSTSTATRFKHYGTFGLRRVVQQIAAVRRGRATLPEYVATRIARLRTDEARLAEAFGGPVEGKRMVVVGPGQLLREARFFAQKNEVTCLDLDVIPKGIDVVAYAKMLRANGPGRVIKTVGRKLIGNDRPEYEEWKRQLGRDSLPDPRCVVGDICDGVPHPGTWDILASWSLFQSIPDPHLAVKRCADALAPGGVLYMSVQLWTCNTGHHDIRAYTGQEHELPLFAHLRPGHEHEVQPSAWLNKLRLADWRRIYDEHCPGHTEYQHRYGEEELRARMTPEIRAELSDYSDEELYSVDVFFRWRKPAAR
jgi:SAM-dependent methyltransferase